MNERQLRSGRFDSLAFFGNLRQSFATEGSAKMPEEDHQNRRLMIQIGEAQAFLSRRGFQ
jgi:hypothetical protein